MGRRPTWTDEELVMAVAGSTSFKEVVLRLREEAGGASHRAVRNRVDELGLDTSHFGRTERDDDGRLWWAAEPPAPPEEPTDRRTWSDDDLERAVAAASSLNGVFGELGLVAGGTQWIIVRRAIEELGFDTSHWKRPLGRSARRWTDDDLREAVPLSRSISEVMRRLGLQPGGRTHGVITERIETLGLDTSHMTGQAWLRGRKDPRPPNYRSSLDEILVEDSDYLNNATLKKRLVAEGLLEGCCVECGIDEWNGRPLSLHLDHINGDRRDQRIENLRLLCPNCLSQTETYCGRNKGRYASEAAAPYIAA